MKQKSLIEMSDNFILKTPIIRLADLWPSRRWVESGNELLTTVSPDSG